MRQIVRLLQAKGMHKRHSAVHTNTPCLPPGAGNIGNNLAGYGEVGNRGNPPPTGKLVSCTGEAPTAARQLRMEWGEVLSRTAKHFWQ